jgi:hypothetical protein
MPKQAANPGPQYLDADHEAIVTFADTYFEDEEERESFVDTLMERRGYQRTTGWSSPAPAEPEPPAPNGAPARPQRPGYFKK